MCIRGTVPTAKCSKKSIFSLFFFRALYFMVLPMSLQFWHRKFPGTVFMPLIEIANYKTTFHVILTTEIGLNSNIFNWYNFMYIWQDTYRDTKARTFVTYIVLPLHITQCMRLFLYKTLVLTLMNCNYFTLA